MHAWVGMFNYTELAVNRFNIIQECSLLVLSFLVMFTAHLPGLCIMYIRWELINTIVIIDACVLTCLISCMIVNTMAYIVHNIKRNSCCA